LCSRRTIELALAVWRERDVVATSVQGVAFAREIAVGFERGISCPLPFR
jgi:hypothetical protein